MVSAGSDQFMGGVDRGRQNRRRKAYVPAGKANDDLLLFTEHIVRRRSWSGLNTRLFEQDVRIDSEHQREFVKGRERGAFEPPLELADIRPIEVGPCGQLVLTQAAKFTVMLERFREALRERHAAKTIVCRATVATDYSLHDLLSRAFVPARLCDPPPRSAVQSCFQICKSASCPARRLAPRQGGAA